MKNKLLIWGVFATLLLVCVPVTALAKDATPGVAYRGHIQDIGNYPTDENVWIQGPEELGTEGRSLRLEGFQIKLTGTIPEGAHIKYNVHVQDVGWLYSETDTSTWAQDGAFAGTTARSLRIEAVSIILTDADGNALPGYSVEYRGHIQNKGDAPLDGTWLKDGDQLGTVGESLRLEALDIKIVSVPTNLTAYNALLASISKSVETDYTATSWTALQKALTDNTVTADTDQIDVNKATAIIQTAFDALVKKAAPVVYDTAGTYGPETGTQVIDGDVIVKADGIKLRNLHINGDLTIGADQVAEKAEASAADTINDDQMITETTAGSMTTELENVYIAYFTRMTEGTSVSISGSPSQAFSFSLPGGAQFTATTPGGGVGTGAPMQITARASGSSGSSGGVSVGGAISSLSLLTPGMQLFLAPGCQVQLASVLMGAPNCGIMMSPTAVLQNVLVQGTGATFSGPGTIQHADIQANGASFATRPGAFTVAPGVVAQPSMPALPDSGGGGYTPPGPVSVESVTLNTNALNVGVTNVTQLIATVAPANATNQKVKWISSNDSVATVDATGKVTGMAFGVTTIRAITDDGGFSESCTVTVAEGYEVTIDANNKATITKFQAITTTAVDIPTTINGADVVAIGAGSFGGNSITSVIIPATVTSIGDLAFKDCKQLTTVSFGAGSSLLSIGKDAFSGCEKLNIITLPNQLSTIDDRAFQNCTSLKSLELPASLTTLGESAFSTTGLTAMSIPNLVTSIELFAFEKCPDLTTVTLPANLQTLGNSAFLNCDKLTDITIPASVTTIGVSAFHSCDSLVNVTFAAGSKLTEIPSGMCSECISLTTVTFNGAPQITTIGDNAFRCCSKLVNINLPDAVTVIDNLAFKACGELTAIAIPDTVTTIKGSAFEVCTKLNAVSFGPGSQLNFIGEIAFRDCPKLIDITIPKLVTTIGSEAFGFDTDKKLIPCTYTFRGAAPTTFAADAIPVAPAPTIRYYENYAGFSAAKWVGYPTKQIILAAPAGLTANASYSNAPTVSLDWTDVPGATAYDVYVSKSSNSFSGSPITVTTSAATISSGLDSGYTYYFAVKARDAYGESLRSDSASADVPYQVPVASITVVSTPTVLTVGGTAQLSAVFTPAEATNKNVSWSSADTNIAMVNATTGLITTVNPGSVEMTGTTADGGKTANCTVMVSPVAVQGVSISLPTAMLNKGTTTQLSATVLPTNATNQAVSWKSDTPDVAAVENNGTVTANSEGTATITVTTADGTKTASCAVTVKDLNPTITGVSLPYFGGTPAATITDTDQYSGTIVWKEKGGADLATNATFSGAKTYVATITLIPKAPYTAEDIPADFFKIDGATSVSNTAGTSVITAEFPATSPFQIDGKGLITSYVGLSGDVTIPDTVNNIAVTGIGLNVFNKAPYRLTLTEISIPATVTIIKEGAFHNCYYLSTVTFRGTSQLKALELNAFSACALTSIALPTGLVTIGPYAFYQNNLSGTLTIPATVTSIGEYAFEGNTPNTLTTLVIGDGTALNIAADAFKAQALTSITLPDNVTFDNSSTTMGAYSTDLRAAYVKTDASGAAGTYTYNSTTKIWSK